MERYAAPEAIVPIKEQWRRLGAKTRGEQQNGRLYCRESVRLQQLFMAKDADGSGMRRNGGGPGAPDGVSAGSGTIPDKLYFRIGEVAALCRVPTYVLRFWQTEFAQLRPGKSGTGQRLYRKRDVEMALRIKHLLHEQGYTIAGAKAVLAGEAAAPGKLRAQPEPPPAAGDEPARARLELVRSELRELLALLEGAPSGEATQEPE